MELRRVNVGSKSEHDAVVLVTPEGAFTMRLEGGRPFNDPALQELVGLTIRADGERVAGQFIVRRYEVL